MKILKRDLHAVIALAAFIVLALLVSYLLIVLFKTSPFGLPKISAPTVYDGLSYYNEISAYSEDIRSLNLVGVLKAYGVLVVVLYSPIIIFPSVASWWALTVNCILLFYSAILFAVALDKCATHSASFFCSSSTIFSTAIPKAGVSPLAVFSSVLLVLLNLYYIGSVFVPSKDILALALSLSYLFVLVRTITCHAQLRRPLAYVLTQLSFILLLALFVRITLFLSLALATFYYILLSRRRMGLLSSPIFLYLLSAVFFSSLFLVFQSVPFESAGSLLNNFLASPFKFAFIPFLPFIYSLWDFLKAPGAGLDSLNIVQLAFSLNGITILPLLLSFFACLYTGNNRFQHGSSRCLWVMTSIVLSGPISSGYVHVRYIYEFIPWILVAFALSNGYAYIRLYLFRLFPLAALAKLILGLGGLLVRSPNLPPYTLPPHLL